MLLYFMHFFTVTWLLSSVLANNQLTRSKIIDDIRITPQLTKNQKKNASLFKQNSQVIHLLRLAALSVS